MELGLTFECNSFQCACLLLMRLHFYPILLYITTRKSAARATVFYAGGTVLRNCGIIPGTPIFFSRFFFLLSDNNLEHVAIQINGCDCQSEKWQATSMVSIIMQHFYGKICVLETKAVFCFCWRKKTLHRKLATSAELTRAQL